MSLSRWKVLACTLTVGVGGLAVFATDPIPAKTEPAKEPAPLPNLTVKPATPSGGSDTPPPIVPVKGEDIELTIPIPPTPAKTDEPKKSAAGPVFEPITPDVPPVVVPAKAEAEAKDAKKPDDKFKAPPVPEIKSPVTKEPKPPEIFLPPIDERKKTDAPKPPPVDVKIPDTKPTPEPTIGPPVKVETPPPPIAPLDKKPEPPAPTLTPAPPAKAGSVRVPLTPGKTTDSAKLKLTLRMGDGEPRFEIRNTATTDLLLKVYGQKIEMKPQSDAKSSLAGVTAVGKVRFTAPGIEGTCEHLTIMSGTGELLLEGDIRLKTKHGKAWGEISADRMVYQIGTNGLTARANSRVTPAGYSGD